MAVPILSFLILEKHGHVGSSRRLDSRLAIRWDRRLATRDKRLFGLTLGGPWCCSGNTCRRRNRPFRRLSRAAWAHVRQSARRCVGAGYATHIKTFESCLGLLAQLSKLAPLRGLYPMSTAVKNFFFRLSVPLAECPPSFPTLCPGGTWCAPIFERHRLVFSSQVSRGIFAPGLSFF